MRRERVKPRAIGRFVPVGIFACVGLAFSLGAFVQVEEAETTQRRTEFERLAHDQTDAITAQIGSTLANLQSIRGLFNASVEVSRSEFRAFVESLEIGLPIQALEWIPRISRAERRDFERSARDVTDFPGFAITERQAPGLMVAAADRPEYFPVYFVEPLSGNEAAVGFDLGSNPARLEALEASRDSGRPAATARITLVQETGDQYGFLVFVPIYRGGSTPETVALRRKALLGFGLGVFRIGDMVRAALGHNADGPSDIEIYLLDTVAPRDSRLLYPKSADQAARRALESPIRYMRQVRVAERAWSIVVAPVKGSRFFETAWQPWAVLVAGVLITTLAALYFVALERSKQNLRRAKTEAEAADRMKSQFLTIMSHELRTPMHGILGTVGLVLDTELSPSQRNYLKRIKDSGDLLLGLLNSILDLSKIEAGVLKLEHRDFLVRPLIDGVAVLLESRIRQKGLALEVVVEPDVPEALKGDPERIRQVLFNLIGNAIKFTETGGIALRLSRTAHGDDRLALLWEVSDTGIGIDPDRYEGIFGRFSQVDASTSRRFDGSGLGLAICKELVQMMGGSIGVRGNPEGGSTFWFTLRCARGEISAVREADRTVMTGPSEGTVADRPLRILVAEDNPVNQLIAVETLEGAGHHVDAVSDGLEAVDAVQAGHYDIVLMDIQMPRLDGKSATARIRELPGRASRVPIVALTANAMAGEGAEYLAAGMDEYLAKPFEAGHLFAVIRRLTRSDARSAQV